MINPNHPEYVSGHSTYSGAAAAVLTSFFGDDTSFSTSSVGLPGVTRSYTSFSSAAEEAGQSRIYGGIHFQFSNQDGLEVGRQLADWVLSTFSDQDTHGPRIFLDVPETTTTKTGFAITGQVLDRSGISIFQIQVNSGDFVDVVLDETGNFSLPLELPLDGSADGQHTITFAARDAAGNIAAPKSITVVLDTRAPTITLGATSLQDGGVLTPNSRLAGTADPTGSKLISLSYQLNGGTTIPISFDRQTGAFDAGVDISKLAVGQHSLGVRTHKAG